VNTVGHQVALQAITNVGGLVAQLDLKYFTKVGRSREWFNTPNRENINELIFATLTTTAFNHKIVD